MTYVIRCPDFEQYLKAYDPDTHAPGETYPTGYSEWTDKPEEAMIFATHTEALALWKTQSKVSPLRPDGKPNRPLTAVTISVERLKLAKDKLQ
jgi:hypothetical protein